MRVASTCPDTVLARNGATSPGGQLVTRRRTAAGAKGSRGSGPGSGTWPRPAPNASASPIGNDRQRAIDREAASATAEPEALVLSGWFDSGDGDTPYAATVRFTGRLADVGGKPRARDAFVQEEMIDRVVPGTGPVSITTWVYGLRPGRWAVNAELVRVSTEPGGPVGAARWRLIGARPVHPAAWSWRRWALSVGPEITVKTRWAALAPLARIPAVIPGSYPVLAVLGALVALATQGAILATRGVPVGRSLLVSLLAVAFGLLGAKVWYGALHPEESFIKGGWAVDGFLVVAPIVAVVSLHVFGLPFGAFFDATAPGLFFAIAIGRVGCFLTGCCAGRSTGSRWGFWSSDRRVGARRVPAQLLESAAGLLIGAVSLPLILDHALPIDGLIFVAALAAYAGVRQVLLRLRAERRTSPRSLSLTAGAVVVVLVVVAVMSLVHPAGRPSVAAAPLITKTDGGPTNGS